MELEDMYTARQHLADGLACIGFNRAIDRVFHRKVHLGWIKRMVQDRYPHLIDDCLRLLDAFAHRDLKRKFLRSAIASHSDDILEAVEADDELVRLSDALTSYLHQYSDLDVFLIVDY
ncbi:hypothetical protein Q9323_08895 [Pseudomonas fulva]|uniref:hypothetical protein n=1 Tax=Pseudomonas fulva TaxID=47880 RepID=UPI0031F6F33D